MKLSEYKEEDKFLLVCDLDGTLLPESSEILVWRPFTDKLFQFCKEWNISVAIWSNGGPERVAKAVAQIQSLYDVKPLFVKDGKIINRSRAGTEVDTYFDWYSPETIVKPLAHVWRCWKKHGFNRRNTVILENDAFKCRKNYGNQIIISTWEIYRTQDTTLLDVIELLKKIRTCPDVRNVNKTLTKQDVHLM